MKKIKDNFYLVVLLILLISPNLVLAEKKTLLTECKYSFKNPYNGTETLYLTYEVHVDPNYQDKIEDYNVDYYICSGTDSCNKNNLKENNMTLEVINGIDDEKIFYNSLEFGNYISDTGISKISCPTIYVEQAVYKDNGQRIFLDQYPRITTDEDGLKKKMEKPGLFNRAYKKATKDDIKNGIYPIKEVNGTVVNHVPDLDGDPDDFKDDYDEEYILNYENICSENSVKKVFKIIGIVFLILKILIPFILIVLGMVDLCKAIIDNDEKSLSKSLSTFVKRIIAGIIIFFVPTIILALFNLTELNSSIKGKFDGCKNCIFYPNDDIKCNIK